MIKENLEIIEQRIAEACIRAGRKRDEVTLIAVSKTKPNDMLVEAYNLGIRNFGENKVQELVGKYDTLNAGFEEKVNWHMIGHLQRNKVKYIIDKVALIHSVDSVRLAQEIEKEAAKKNIVADILIEVNIAQEETKFGVSADEVLPLILNIASFEHIRIRGLMTIAPYVENPEKNRDYFKKMRQLYVDIKTKNIDNIYNKSILADNAFDLDKILGRLNRFDILSMGMTGDFEVAIEEGATMVRIGTGIFGKRDYSLS